MTVPSRVDGITAGCRQGPARVSDPMKVVIGKGLDTTTMVVDVPDGTVNKDHVCADIAPKAACFPILTDPAHWDGAGRSCRARSRYYLATVGPVSTASSSCWQLSPRRTPPMSACGSKKAVAPILDSLDASHVTFN